MCFSARASAISFIIGTLLNIYLYRLTENVNVKIVALAFQFSLLMQIPDFLAWSSDCPSPVQSFATKSAYILNILQPVFLIVVALLLQTYSFNTKLIVLSLLVVYVSYFMVTGYFGNLPNSECIRQEGVCRHMNYYWWNQTKYAGTMYFVVLIVSVILLVKPLKFSLSQLGYILTTFAVSMTFYNCGVPSIWCFFQVLAPLFTILSLKVFEIN